MSPERFLSWLRAQKWSVPFVLLMAIGFLARPVAPWIVRIVPLVSIVAYLVWLVAGLPTRVKNWLVALAAVAFVCNLAVVLVQSHRYDAASQTLWLDDHIYYLEAESLAAAWKTGFYPDITRAGTRPYMGTLHVDFQRSLAGLFYLFGPSTLTGLILNVFCNSLLPVCTALFVWLIYRNRNDRNLASWTEPELAATLAALLATYHPQQFYWGHLLLKDCYTACWFLTALVLAIAAVAQRSALATLLFAAALGHLFQTRVYAALAVFGGFAAYFLILIPRRAALWLTFSGILMIYLLANYSDAPARLISQLSASIGALLPHAEEGPLKVLMHLVAAVPRMLLASYAWVPAYSSAVPLYGVYGGMWFLYILVYPAALNGLLRTLRLNIPLSSIPIVAVVLGFSVLMTSVHGGVANRQRLFMEYVAIGFAGYGYVAPNRKIFLIYYASLLMYIIGHLITVMIRF